MKKVGLYVRESTQEQKLLGISIRRTSYVLCKNTVKKKDTLLLLLTMMQVYLRMVATRNVLLYCR